MSLTLVAKRDRCTRRPAFVATELAVQLALGLTFYTPGSRAVWVVGRALPEHVVTSDARAAGAVVAAALRAALLARKAARNSGAR